MRHVRVSHSGAFPLVCGINRCLRNSPTYAALYNHCLFAHRGEFNGTIQNNHRDVLHLPNQQMHELPNENDELPIIQGDQPINVVQHIVEVENRMEVDNPLEEVHNRGHVNLRNLLGDHLVSMRRRFNMTQVTTIAC